MTDRELELQLRAWYRAQVPVTEVAPSALRASVPAIPRTVVRPVVVVTRRRISLLAAAAVLATTLIGLVALGPGHAPRPTPSPSASGLASTVPIVAPSVAPTPTPFDATGLMAVYQIDYQTDGTPVRVFTLDPTTQAQRQVATLALGTVPQVTPPWARIKWLSDQRTIEIFSIGDSANPIAGDQIDAHTGTVTAAAALIESLSPDGAFGARREEDIVIVDRQGKVVRHLPLPPSPFLGDLGPWSPDGSLIAVAGCQPCNVAGKGPDTTNRQHIYLLPVDGSPARVLGNELSDTTIGNDIVWSPDGSTIAASMGGVVLVDVATGRFTRLTSNPNDIQLAWSNDGSRIAYTQYFGTGLGIWVIDAGGTHRSRLTTAAAKPEDHTSADQLPVWSPDGRTVLFTRGVRLVPAAFGDLWQVPSGGGTPELVLQNAIADW